MLNRQLFRILVNIFEIEQTNLIKNALSVVLVNNDLVSL